jgi:hypothetical protein
MSEIETLEDWNAVLGGCSGCCELPECPVPELVVENHVVSLCAVTPAAAKFPPSGLGEDAEEDTILYEGYSWSISGTITDDAFATGTGSETGTFTPAPKAGEECGGRNLTGSFSYSRTTFYDEEQEQIQSAETGSYSVNTTDVPAVWEGTVNVTEYDLFGDVTSSGSIDDDFEQDGPSSFGTATNKEWVIGETTAVLTYDDTAVMLVGYDGAVTVTFAAAYTATTASEELFAAVVSDPTWEAGGPALASLEVTLATDEVRITGAGAVRGRYRWRIPVGHEGTFFRIDWDEVFYPLGWDAVIEDPENPGEEIPDPAAPVPVLTPKSVEWTGPGDLEDATDATWLTEWSAVVRVPEGEEGTVEVRNVRYSCYRSRAGSKPQVAESFGIEEEPVP